MVTTITYDEVATLVGANIPSLNPGPNIEHIRVLCRHFEQALQCLPCPQSTLHRWEGMVMARELYTLLNPNLFCLPNDPGDVAVYGRPILARQPVNNTPLNRTERHHGYGPVLPHQQNTFGMLCLTCVDSDKESVDAVAMQVAALTCQSQLTASIAANSSQHVEQQFASQQNLMHENMHQIITQVNGLSFNQSNAGQGSPMVNGNGGRRHNCKRRTQGVAPPVFDEGQFDVHSNLPQLPADLPQALHRGLSPMEACPKADKPPDSLCLDPPAASLRVGQYSTICPQTVMAVLTQRRTPQHPHS
jgi:hypothetical protein